MNTIEYASFLQTHLCEETSLGRVSNLVVDADVLQKVIEAMDEYQIQSEYVGKELVRLAASSQRKHNLLGDVVQSSRQLQ